jgi:predicted outer membrane protein
MKMIRNLLAGTAVLTLVTGTNLALAQDQPAQNQESITESEEVLTPEEPTLATAFLGQPVYSSEDPESDNIGDVNDLIVGDDGKITHAVVGVGGFLGIGEKDVAVPFDELQVVEQEGEVRLVYSATKEQLEAADPFDRTAYDPGARFAVEQAALQPDAMAPAGGIAPTPADQAAAPAQQEVVAAADAGADSTEAQEFVDKAAVSNQFEIESSQAALDAAESQEVKDFAQKMVDDHSKAGEDLKAAVENAGAELTVPAELDKEHADKLAQLQSLSGAEFDKQYVEMQTAAHDAAVDLFSSYAEGGDNEALKDFAANTLPTLEEHKEQVHSIAPQ